jgi:hypothetical protein
MEANKMAQDMVDKIISYEQGDLSANGILDLFAELVKNGSAWSLQGHYGRTAQAFIDRGYISKQGKVLQYFE